MKKLLSFLLILTLFLSLTACSFNMNFPETPSTNETPTVEENENILEEDEEDKILKEMEQYPFSYKLAKTSDIVFENVDRYTSQMFYVLEFDQPYYNVSSVGLKIYTKDGTKLELNDEIYGFRMVYGSGYYCKDSDVSHIHKNKSYEDYLDKDHTCQYFMLIQTTKEILTPDDIVIKASIRFKNIYAFPEKEIVLEPNSTISELNYKQKFIHNGGLTKFDQDYYFIGKKDIGAAGGHQKFLLFKANPVENKPLLALNGKIEFVNADCSNFTPPQGCEPFLEIYNESYKIGIEAIDGSYLTSQQMDAFDYDVYLKYTQDNWTTYYISLTR